MENGNRTIAWIGGILIVGVAVLLGWLVWTNKEKKPESTVTQANIIGDSLATPVELPTQEPPAQPPPQVVMDTEGRYTVQVSSWRTQRRAERDAQRFSEKGFNAYVQSAYIPSLGGTWYRVRVGAYATKAEAREMAARLTELLESGYWVDRYRKP
ncbi:MAG: SPOR domain-containing protein [candidate division KSB1 bacterium]|nr:SPOR domain-containing protein [candidate division KSB1 bacterium]MDZ7364659.1 SPOR domain-containing protein [candidate division KSB1 bacterium]MDZ7402593.1 SPOR domain-containing protein [candidate division KSB1 bacterium]